jgi:UDP:flavonoid glycosyltransferase YjiC (YdhE family)
VFGLGKRKKKPTPEETYEAINEVLRKEKIRRFAERHAVSEEEAARILSGKKSKDDHSEEERRGVEIDT